MRDLLHRSCALDGSRTSTSLRRAKANHFRQVLLLTATELAQFYGSYVLGFLSRARVAQYRLDVLFLVLHVLSFCDALERIEALAGRGGMATVRGGAGGEEKTQQLLHARRSPHENMLTVASAKLLVILSFVAGPCSLVTKTLQRFTASDDGMQSGAKATRQHQPYSEFA